MSNETFREKIIGLVIASEFLLGAILTHIPGLENLGVLLSLSGIACGVAATSNTINHEKKL